MVDVKEDPSRLVGVGKIMGAHGLRGEVKVLSYTADPAAIAAFGPLTDASRRRRLRLSVRERRSNGVVIGRIDGVDDRQAAEALRGVELFIERDALPEPAPEEYYFADLIGLAVDLVDSEGRLLQADFGKVQDAVDLGGGPLLDVVRADGGEVMVPFTVAAVPAVDLARRRLAIANLPGLITAGEEP